MYKTIGRNDPCWCGSGRKYKRCHLNRAQEEPVSLQELITTTTKVFGKEYCLHPQAAPGVCRGSIVKAHSIQKSGGLSQLDRNGHVYTFINDVASILKTGQVAKVSLIGINRASTFTGFCGFHDAKTFEPIDNHPFVGTDQQVFLLAYRALCRELFMKKASADLIKEARNVDKGKSPSEQFATQDFLGNWERHMVTGLRDGRYYKSIYDETLLKSDYTRISSYIVRLGSPPSFLCSSFITPEYDFLGRVLQDFEIGNRVLDHLAFSVVATSSGGAAVFSWLGSSRSADMILESLNQITDARLPDSIARFAFEYSENLFAAPSWWEGLSDLAKASLLHRMSAILPEANDLRDDGMQLVSWKVKSRETNSVSSERNTQATR